jgi:NADPH-dependent 2,4-dienoyl-CoA reductase/sulfur reductase-like enzyme
MPGPSHLADEPVRPGMSALTRIVVIGASLAGLRTAEALRHQGHRGEIVLVGDEPLPPYDRPPLSKQILDGSWTSSQLELPCAPGLQITWRLGQVASSLDLVGHQVHLVGGDTIDYDKIVLATGARARPWPGPVPSGVMTLRSADDAKRLAARMSAGSTLLVVGAGFLGGEVAAAGRRRGLAVTLVESEPLPLLRTGGAQLGEFVADLHRREGVDLRLATEVTDFIADGPGITASTLSGAILTDGTHVSAETAVVALGAVPNTDWLLGSGLQLDHGIVCDALCRPLLDEGTATEDAVAVGDVARWPHPLRDGLLSLGHWSNAGDMASAAAKTILRPENAEPYQPLPSFWSDLHGAQLRSAGLPQDADTYMAVEVDPQARRLVLEARRGDQLVGVITANRTSRLSSYRSELGHAFARNAL